MQLISLRQLLCTSFFCFLLFTLLGCRKMSNSLDKEFDAQITKNFFKVSVSSNPEVAKVADNWSKQKGFIEQLDVFVKKNGMPVWDKSMVKLFNNAQVELRIESSPASSGVIMIPLKDPLTSDIKSYVVCNKHADSVYTYRLYNKEDLVNINANGLDSLKNATNVTLSLFSYFEKEVNGKASTFFGGNANLTIKNVSMIETTPQTNNGENLPIIETYFCGNYFTIRWVEQVIVNGNTVFQARETLVAVACVQLIGGWDPSDVGSPMPRVMDGGGGGGGVYVYSGNNNEPPAAWWTYGSGYNGVYLTGTWDSYQNIYPYWANYPITTSYSETDFLIHNLIEILELQQPGQINLLRGNLNLVFPLHEYLTNSPEPVEEKVRKVKEHLDYMVANQAYKTFVLNYTSNDNTATMWWENDTWLTNNFSFSAACPLGWCGLKQAEKVFIFLYPVSAFMIKINSDVAKSETRQMFNIDINAPMPPNDKSNAFLHAFWCSMNLFSVGEDKARAFATAHETETPQQLQMERTMDIFNNEVGFNIAKTQSNLFSNHVYQALISGQLRYLSPINNSDPYFWGGFLNGTPVPETHGITGITLIVPTNQ